MKTTRLLLSSKTLLLGNSSNNRLVSILLLLLLWMPLAFSSISSSSQEQQQVQVLEGTEPLSLFQRQERRQVQSTTTSTTAATTTLSSSNTLREKIHPFSVVLEPLDMALTWNQANQVLYTVESFLNDAFTTASPVPVSDVVLARVLNNTFSDAKSTITMDGLVYFQEEEEDKDKEVVLPSPAELSDWAAQAFIQQEDLQVLIEQFKNLPSINNVNSFATIQDVSYYSTKEAGGDNVYDNDNDGEQEQGTDNETDNGQGTTTEGTDDGEGEQATEGEGEQATEGGGEQGTEGEGEQGEAGSEGGEEGSEGQQEGAQGTEEEGEETTESSTSNIVASDNSNVNSSNGDVPVIVGASVGAIVLLLAGLLVWGKRRQTHRVTSEDVFWRANNNHDLERADSNGDYNLPRKDTLEDDGSSSSQTRPNTKPAKGATSPQSVRTYESSDVDSPPPQLSAQHYPTKQQHQRNVPAVHVHPMQSLVMMSDTEDEDGQSSLDYNVDDISMGDLTSNNSIFDNSTTIIPNILPVQSHPSIETFQHQRQQGFLKKDMLQGADAGWTAGATNGASYSPTANANGNAAKPHPYHRQQLFQQPTEEEYNCALTPTDISAASLAREQFSQPALLRPVSPEPLKVILQTPNTPPQGTTPIKSNCLQRTAKTSSTTTSNNTPTSSTPKGLVPKTMWTWFGSSSQPKSSSKSKLDDDDHDDNGGETTDDSQRFYSSEKGDWDPDDASMGEEDQSLSDIFPPTATDKDKDEQYLLQKTRTESYKLQRLRTPPSPLTLPSIPTTSTTIPLGDTYTGRHPRLAAPQPQSSHVSSKPRPATTPRVLIVPPPPQSTTTTHQQQQQQQHSSPRQPPSLLHPDSSSDSSDVDVVHNFS